ncbi:MAG: phage holin family protein [Steroidobacteraceae bacterium]
MPKAAPALLRHIAAYIELAAYDLAQSRRDFAANLIASVIAGVAVFFTVLLSCAAVVAATWDTPHRLTAIVWMAGVFLAVAVLALIYRSKAAKEQAPFLASVRREWQEDSVIFEHILSDED